MRTATIIVALAILPAVAEAATLERARYLMGTVCEVAVGTEAQADAVFAEGKRVEAMLSTWTSDSELARVNRGEQPSPELALLLDETRTWSQKTGGAFDPHVKALIEVWKTREAGALPDRNAIDAARHDTRIEEGAFGKGYALDRMLALTTGDAMIDFGGQIAVRGSIRAAIADPLDRKRPIVELTIANASLSTSSGSEKTFEVNGRRFSHIFDPRTGEALPPRGSVSVLASSALVADILSTALYVMGEDDGLRWANANGVAAIFITPDHHIRLSTPAREQVRELALIDRHYALKD
jgi:thiamine biosynthesis lipoprotein